MQKAMEGQFQHLETPQPLRGQEQTIAITPLSGLAPPGYPDMREVMQLEVPMLRHVPSGARTLLGQVVGKACAQLACDQSWEALLRFTVLPKYVLRAHIKGGKKHAGNSSEPCAHGFSLRKV